MKASTEKRKGFFYGWWIVAGAFLIMATCYTIFVNCIPLFQKWIVEDLSITMAQFNTGVSLCTVVAIFASLAFGALIDKVSSKLLGSFTVIITAIVLLLFSFTTKLWGFYVLCIVAGMIVVAGTRLLVSVLTTNWFTERRGLAVSIALAGSGFGGVILSPVTTKIIVAYDWRVAFLVLAVIALVASLPIVIFSFRNRPSDKGLLPYGLNPQEQARKLAKAAKPNAKIKKIIDFPVTVSIGLKVLIKNPGFWLLIVGFVAMGIVNGAIITNSITNMTSVVLDDTEIVLGGHSSEWAGNVWAVYLGVVIVAKIFLGFIYDQWGLKVGTIVGTATCIVASIALCFPATFWGPILAAVAFGFGTCMGTVSPPVMVAKEYGKKDLGMVVGIVTAFELFGAAIGAVVSGVLFDNFFSFTPAWIMTFVASIVMGITLMISIPAARKLAQRRREQGAPELDEEGFEIVPAEG
ncbi:MAG: MFS transporter [Coriobacteriia bacterium]|nr:MFS transporter [Coriobacteriia bacterium]